MKVLTPNGTELDELAADPAARAAAASPAGDVEDTGSRNAEPAAEAEGTRQAPARSVALAAFLSMGAAAFMLGGVFKGFEPRVVGVASVALGVGVVYYSVRSGRGWVQYLVAPLGALVGAVLVMPDANARGNANLIDLILEAVHSGGLLQPPIPFDPGWRFILALLATVLGAGVAAIAIARNKPKLAVALPVPFAMLGELVQPSGAELWATLLAVIMIVAGLGIAYGADLVTQGVVVTARFETRRLMRTGAMILAALVAIVGMSHVGILFPQPDHNRVIPPERPQMPPPQADRPLFTYTVQGGRLVPLRVGVIDVYDPKQHAWLLPPYDLSRNVTVSDGRLPALDTHPGQTYTVSVTVDDAQGHVLPEIESSLRVHGLGDNLAFDPRTDILQLSERRVAKGMSYQLTVAQPPTGQDLMAVGPPPDSLKAFLQAPPPPQAVLDILARAPSDAFDRLQALRYALYTHVVAAGSGRPVDLPVSRVSDMLAGKEATPYEITAAEALLARWAGVPSRMGYGYYGGNKQKDGSYELHPGHGAMWLEAYFRGYGWVPIVGTPLHARGSTSNNHKTNPLIRASDDIGLQIFAAVKEETPLAYYQLLVYWLGLLLPYALTAGALLVVYPGLLKLARGVMRRRWAAKAGLKARILVAYATFRDVANDLTYGDPLATPLEYLAAVQDDEEHEELAWLVTRALWGDLKRGLDEADATRAEELSRSVVKRLLRAQSVLNLFLAFIARTSLREPYSTALANPWLEIRLRRHASAPSGRRRGQGRRRLLPVPGRLRRLIPGLAGIISSLLLVGCGAADFHGPSAFAANLVPSSIGQVRFPRANGVEALYRKSGRQALASKGEVWLVRHDDYIEGSVQIQLLKPDVLVYDPVVLSGMDQGIGGPPFQRVRLVPNQIAWEKDLPDTRVYMWFPPRSNSIELVVLRRQFQEYRELVIDLIDYQLGIAPQPFAIPTPAAGDASTPSGADSLGNVGAPNPIGSLNGLSSGGPSPVASP